MTSAKHAPHKLVKTRSLLNRLIELPDLAHAIKALPVQSFAALIRKVGLEDAGEIVALATTEQLVHAFDEDLFVSERAGERETLDVGRFVVWLELLLEAGDEVAAARVAELDEDFVAHALSGIVLVMDEDALRERLDDSDEEESSQVDKALESALREDLDGYLVIAKRHDGWDAALALILALDRNHRALLVRLLDLLARVGSRYIGDLDELWTVLCEGDSLADDVEAAREERRSKQGYVEAQAARAFLALARSEDVTDRDPLTRAYFRELERSRAATRPGSEVVDREPLRALPKAIQQELSEVSAEANVLAITGSTSRATVMRTFTESLRELSESEPRLFSERMEEFAYLANVLLAGHELDGARLQPRAAADAVLATVAYGAVIELCSAHAKGRRKATPSASEFAQLLRTRSVDLLFRVAASRLSSATPSKLEAAKRCGLLYSSDELEAALH